MLGLIDFIPNKGEEMKAPTHKELVDYINRHLTKTGEKPSQFGRRVLSDSGSMSRLYGGTDPRLTTVHKIINAIEGER